MAAGDLITTDWQMEYDGALWGDLTDLALVKVEGVLDLPGVTSGDRNRLRRHGTYAGDDFLAGREVEVTLEVYGSDASDFASKIAALTLATRPGRAALPLVLRLPGVAGGAKVQTLARVRRRSLPLDLDYLYRLPTAVLQFYADDPRFYSTPAGSAVVGLPTSGGGLTFPAAAPFVFGTVVAGGNVTLTNAGTFDSSPVVRIDGPVTNPSLQNVTTGKTLTLTLDVPAGQYVDLDFDRRTVLLNGTASRYSALVSTSTWWDLIPGANEVQFRAVSFGAGTATFTYRSAWV